MRSQRTIEPTDCVGGQTTNRRNMNKGANTSEALRKAGAFTPVAESNGCQKAAITTPSMDTAIAKRPLTVPSRHSRNTALNGREKCAGGHMRET